MCDSEDDSDWEVGPYPCSLPFSERGLPLALPIAGARRSKAPSRAGTGAEMKSFPAALGVCSRSPQRPMAPRRQGLIAVP